MTKARQNVALGVLKGAYGPIHVNAVRSWTRANSRAKDEYWQHPFEREPGPPKLRRNAWTEKEFRFLQQKCLEGWPYHKIAERLGRTPAAVSRKANDSGLTNRRTRG